MENNTFDTFNDQFVVSHELVQLMQWIVKHNPEGLKKLIQTTLSREKTSRLKAKGTYKDLYTEDDLQNSLLDFFGLMELILYETENHQQEESFLQKNMLPSMSRVDTSICDQSTVQSCAAIATKELDKNPQAVFLEELLKRWKPAKKETFDN